MSNANSSNANRLARGRRLYDESHTAEGRADARARHTDSGNKVAAGRALFDATHRRHTKETDK